MRSFLSPGERALLEELPFGEARTLLDCFDLLDARLESEHEPLTAVQPELGPLPEAVRARREAIAP